MEYRIKDVELSCGDGEALKLGGYINVTNRESEMLYNKKKGKWFKEVMTRGVFGDAISRAKDIPLLFEHNWDKKLACTSNATLQLKEDQIGLRFDAVIEDRAIYEQVKSGVINSCSFGFKALKEGIEEIDSRLEKRFIEAMELFEVSLVKNPAYVGSLCEVRSYEEELEMENRKAEEEKEAKEDKASEKEDAPIEKEAPVEEGTEDKDAKEEDPKPSEKEDKNCNEELKDSEKDEEAKEDKDSKEKDSEDRNLTGVTVGAEPINDVIEEAPAEDPIANKEAIKEVLEEVIQEKEEILIDAEHQENVVKQQMLEEQEIHEEIQKDLTYQAMNLSGDIARMRFEILKLKMIKEGI